VDAQRGRDVDGGTRSDGRDDRLAGAIAAGRVPEVVREDDAASPRNGARRGGYFVLNFPACSARRSRSGQGVILYAIAFRSRSCRDSRAAQPLGRRRQRVRSGARAASASSSSSAFLPCTHDEERPRA